MTVPRLLRGLLAVVVGLALTTYAGPSAHADDGDPAPLMSVVTPGDFTGYGFDQCLAPSQKAMNRWWRSSPFTAVGIYISGNSRACRSQPNLTPAWVQTQVTRGWRLLPITLGPQASCQPRFPRYSDDPKIDPTPGSGQTYTKAAAQGLGEGSSAVAAAQALGIGPGSTLWYDLEGFDVTNTHCRESALRFLSGWTTRLHELGYVSGVYSSAGSGIKALDDARVLRPGLIVLPDRIWIARWDGAANDSTSYIRDDGWRPGGRMKQYLGGHHETHGGVTINIDSNYLNLGLGSVAAPESHCGGVPVDFKKYPKVRSTSPAVRTAALDCLVSEQPAGIRVKPARKGLSAAATSWLVAHGFGPSPVWRRQHWVALLSAGDRPVLKVGSTGAAVRRVQRALNAAGKARLPITGVYDDATAAAVRGWQQRVRLPATGVVAPNSWKRLQAGRF